VLLRRKIEPLLKKFDALTVTLRPILVRLTISSVEPVPSSAFRRIVNVIELVLEGRFVSDSFDAPTEFDIDRLKIVIEFAALEAV
jgi:hypothetical protein